MFATCKLGSHAGRDLHRASPLWATCDRNPRIRWLDHDEHGWIRSIFVNVIGFELSKGDVVGRSEPSFPRPALARHFAVASLVSCCWTGYAAAIDVPVTATTPIKIAVFAFELEDFSAAAGQGSSPIELPSLSQSTEEAKQRLLQSGRYSLIDAEGADTGATKGQGLRNCGGCEAALAMKLGADQALVGVVTKISMTEYVVRLQVSDARNGTAISSFTTGLRMGADYSWYRGVRWLMQNHMLVSK